ncbi:MAG: flavodoxin family protein [Nitrospirota bacterium]
MKTVAFLGSPRRNGNTELLLKEAVRGIQDSGFDVQTFNLNLMKIRPCLDCDACRETGICTVKDAMEKIYTAIKEGHRFILASPIFFFSLSAQAKIMIDRCQTFWCEKYLLKKPIVSEEFRRKGLLLLVGGMKKEIGFECAEVTAKAFFRTISVPEHKTLSFMGIDAKGEILKHPTALSDAYQAGKELVTI